MHLIQLGMKKHRQSQYIEGVIMSSIDDALKNPTDPELWKKVCEELQPEFIKDIYDEIDRSNIPIPRKSWISSYEMWLSIWAGYNKYREEKEQ